MHRRVSENKFIAQNNVYFLLNLRLKFAFALVSNTKQYMYGKGTSVYIIFMNQT